MTDEGEPKGRDFLLPIPCTVRALIRLLRRHLPPAGEGFGPIVYPPHERAVARRFKQKMTQTGVTRTNQRPNASLTSKFR